MFEKRKKKKKEQFVMGNGVPRTEAMDCGRLGRL
jgi:hypothetical protein